MNEQQQRLRFSIIIPAHNEEADLGNTLEHVTALSYPKDAYEALVIENGSSDKTLEIAKHFESSNVTILHSEKGVSRAKNAGILRARADSDWVIFLDADVILDANFLNELDVFLRRSRHFSVGTTRVRPFPETTEARAWFRFYDFIHWFAKKSFSIQIFKRSLFPPLKFNEGITMNEDLDLLNEALAYGSFFYVPTTCVHASTRRFDKEGYWRLLFEWTVIANLPKWTQPKFTYKVIR